MNGLQLYGIAGDIHREAVSKGFWDRERNQGEMLMLVVSELAEALEADRAELPMVYIPLHNQYCDFAGTAEMFCRSGICKPEGAVTELADAVIRCLDIIYSKANTENSPIWNFYEDQKQEQQSDLRPNYSLYDNFGENLLKITDLIVRARRNPYFLMDVIIMCERLSIQLGWNIWDIVSLKFRYNKSRTRMHGKAY